MIATWEPGQLIVMIEFEAVKALAVYFQLNDIERHKRLQAYSPIEPDDLALAGDIFLVLPERHTGYGGSKEIGFRLVYSFRLNRNVYLSENLWNHFAPAVF